ncbi:MAG: CDP-alcohol phosphatidyltransferase family protein [Hyphomicrobiales bacterium]
MATKTTKSRMRETDKTSRYPALCIIGDGNARLWGRMLGERLKKQFSEAGVGRFIVVSQAAYEDGTVIFVRGDAIIDQPLIAVLVREKGLVLTGEGTGGTIALAAHVTPEQGGRIRALLTRGGMPDTDLDLTARGPGELGANFRKSLRKREMPYAMTVSSADRATIEWRMFMGTYKGATDFVTKYIWPWPAFMVTRWLATRRVTPNMVTTVGAILMVAAFFLFLKGVWAEGLTCAWAMTFLDTVDGKLARVTLTSSKWGDIFDHGIDLIHPPFWYMAWGFGLEHGGFILPSGAMVWLLVVIFAGYILQRLMEGVAIKVLRLNIHIWRRIDSMFRQVTARRNPNLVLLTVSALVARPDWGVEAVALWTGLCLILHGLQLIQALGEKRRKGALSSWLDQATSSRS